MKGTWIVGMLIVTFAGLYGAFVAVGSPWFPLTILWVFTALCIGHAIAWLRRKDG